ncbi:CGL125 [Auxenochlorella protothecoides x Auxenochlorella symbiontica]
MPAVKALFAGACNGSIDALFKRASAVNASNGPFDLLICVGQFFGAAGPDDGEYQGPLLEYLTGGKAAPLPTYFMGGWGGGAVSVLEAISAVPESNIHYLGRAGVKEVKGLTLAYLDGTHNAAAFREGPDNSGSARYYTEADIKLLQHSLSLQGDIDVLLTNEWPEGLAEGLPEGVAPPDSHGSPVIAELVMTARPRYHIAAGKPTFFARPPYLNADLGAGAHVTRFIGLAQVGNGAKQKWLHALALTPAAEMTPEALQVQPPGSTGNPFQAAAAKRLKRAAGDAGPGTDLGSQDWRWQEQKKARQIMAAPSLGRPDIIKDKHKTIFVRNVPFAATEEALVEFFAQAGRVVDVVRRTNAEGRLNTWCHIQFDTKEGMEKACQLNGSELMGRQLGIDAAATGPRAGTGKPVEGCWFCLSNANADIDLVVSVGEESYVAVDKGAITDEHVLVVSVEHFPSSQSLSIDCYAEIRRYWAALDRCAAAGGRQLVGFERYMALRKSGGNHCHINALAVSAEAAARARQVFEDRAKAAGFSLTHIPAAAGEAARAALRDVVGDGEYFQAFLPDGSYLVHPIAFGERHPLNYGREVLAELAGVPDRAEWKACAVPVEEERRRSEAFKALFKPHDIMGVQE